MASSLSNNLHWYYQKLHGKLFDTMRYCPKGKVPKGLRHNHLSILVVGIVLADKPNLFRHISQQFRQSRYHQVRQTWGVLKPSQPFHAESDIQYHCFDDYIPRSLLLNKLLESQPLAEYDYIIVVDDDVRLPKHFLDDFIALQQTYDFALAQPARTFDSITSHHVTKQRTDCVARETCFVEIGPLFCVRKDAFKLIFPLDEDSPMGYGVDFTWPCILQQAQKKLGIIDCVPLAHTLRPVAKSYSRGDAQQALSKFLSNKPHISGESLNDNLTEYKLS